MKDCEQVKLPQDVSFEGAESCDYRDIDEDWPLAYAQSEDYYQDNSGPQKYSRWIPPLKPVAEAGDFIEVNKDIYEKDLKNSALILARAKDSSEKLAKEGYFIGTNVYEGDFYHDFDIDGELKDGFVFCFSKKYILPIKNQKHAWQNYCVFYNPNTRPDCCEAYNFSGYYLPQFIKYRIKNGIIYQNQAYENQDFETFYQECYESYLKYFDEMISYEPSSNRRIFDEEGKANFIKNAQETHAKE